MQIGVRRGSLASVLSAFMVMTMTSNSGPLFLDLDSQTQRQVVVDREKGQYLGHPTTAVLADGSILCVYPKGHGKGAIQMKRSLDGGRTWSSRLPTPKNWTSSLETPTIHRVKDPRTGGFRLVLWSGLYPARIASSEDEGQNWTELAPAGSWGGIVVMGCLEQLKDGRLVALFHDDGRFFSERGKAAGVFTLYQTFSSDGGRTWSFPDVVLSRSDLHLCEPGLLRSPDGKTLAVLLRENSRKSTSHIIFSRDEANSWSNPKPLPMILTGDRHTGRVLPDGRVFISFRDMPKEGEWKGDWVAWVGTWEDLVLGREGQYKIRLKDNKDSWDSSYPGVELLADDTILTTTYGHWEKEEEPYILSIRLKVSELDEMARTRRS